MDNLPGGCYPDGMRLLACALLLLVLAVPARAVDDDDSGDTEPSDAGKRLQAIEEGTERDADHPEAAGEEADEADPHDPVETELEPRDPYDDREAEPAPAPHAGREAPAKPPRYPNVLEKAAPGGQATGGKATTGKATTGKGAAPKAPSPLDADD